MNQSQIEQITGLLDNKLSSQEKEELEAILEKDQELAAEFAIQKQMTKILRDFAVSKPLPISEEACWNNIQQRIHAEKNKIGTVETARHFSFHKWSTVAAAACVILCTSVFYIPRIVQQQTTKNSDYYSEVVTGEGISTTSWDGESMCLEWITNAQEIPFES